MSYKLGVFIVHGMGSAKEDFAVDIIRQLKNYVEASGGNPDEICFMPGFWADVVEPKERAIWEQLSEHNTMRWGDMRKFIVSAFGDAVAYQRVPGKQKDMYERIHEQILEDIIKLRNELNHGEPDGQKEKPIVIMAHSLGGYVMSNYIWDRQHNKEVQKLGGNDLLEMKTLATFITYGCNIPLFSLAYDPIESISIPSPQIGDYFPQGTPIEQLHAVCKWLNYYDADDVLGYPLKQLSPSYELNVREDIEINAGKVYESWNPLSHLRYTEDEDFCKPVGKLLTQILDLLKLPEEGRLP